MGTYASASDVLDRWVGQGKPADADQVEMFVGDAETLVLGEFPDLGDRVDVAGDITSEQVKLVIVAMVTRFYKNPEGIRSRSDASSDQFGGTVVYAGDNPGGLALSADERAILSRRPAPGVRGLQVISTTRGNLETRPVDEWPFGIDGDQLIVEDLGS